MAGLRARRLVMLAVLMLGLLSGSGGAALADTGGGEDGGTVDVDQDAGQANESDQAQENEQDVDNTADSGNDASSSAEGDAGGDQVNACDQDADDAAADLALDQASVTCENESGDSETTNTAGDSTSTGDTTATQEATNTADQTSGDQTNANEITTGSGGTGGAGFCYASLAVAGYPAGTYTVAFVDPGFVTVLVVGADGTGSVSSASIGRGFGGGPTRLVYLDGVVGSGTAAC